MFFLLCFSFIIFSKRRENRSLGMSHLQSGNRTQALEYFQKSIDITPDMAYKVIKVSLKIW